MAEFASNDPLAIREVGTPQPYGVVAGGLDQGGADFDGATIDSANIGGPAVGNSALDQADAASTVSIQTWLSHSPWRITAGWSAIAGALSIGLLSNLLDWQSVLDWRMLVLVLLLVDPLWGSIWRVAWGREGILPLGKEQQPSKFWLPYLKADSPAGRLLGIAKGVVDRPADGAADTDNYPKRVDQNRVDQSRSDADIAPMLFRVGLPTLLMAFGVAAALHYVAVWFTIAVVICSVFGWLGRRTWGRPNTILQTIVSVSLPWVLIVYLVREPLSQLYISQGNLTQGESVFAGFESRIFYSFCLMGLWSIHCWGVALARRSASLAAETTVGLASNLAEAQNGALQRYSAPSDSVVSRFGLGRFGTWVTALLKEPALSLLIIADIGLIALILVLREPIWLAILVPLSLPTWFAYLQNAPVDRQPLWRLVAFLASAIAIGQTPLVG